jgi:hypothetical protein
MSRTTAGELRALIWACLVHEDKDLTIEQVGAMLHWSALESIQKSIIEAQRINSPDADDKAEGNPPLVESR